MALDTTIQRLIDSSAAKYNLPPNLLSAVAQAESGGNPKAVSPAGAQGVMQLMPNTSKEFGVSNPFDPKQNINGGAQKLQGILKNTGGNVNKALEIYNRGEGNVQKNPQMPQETQQYISKINSLMGNNQDSQDNAIAQESIDNNPLLKKMDENNNQLHENSVTRKAEEEALIGQMNKEMSSMPEYSPIDMPQWKPTTSPINTKDYQQFASGMLALGLIFGSRGGAGLQAAVNTLNSSMKGYLEGNMIVAQHKKDEFDQQYKSSMAKAKEAQEKLNSIINNKKMSIGMMQSQLSTVMQEAGMDQQSLLADNKDIINIINNNQKTNLAIAKLEEQKKRFDQMINQQSISRASREKIAHDKLVNSGLTGQIATKLPMQTEAVREVNQIIDEAKAHPEVLGAAFDIMPDSNSTSQLIMDFKAGKYPHPLRSNQDQQTYNRQVDFWRKVGQMVERVAYSTNPGRSAAILAFFQKIKAQPTDDPALAMQSLMEFQNTIYGSLADTGRMLATQPEKLRAFNSISSGVGLNIDQNGNLVQVQTPIDIVPNPMENGELVDVPKSGHLEAKSTNKPSNLKPGSYKSSSGITYTVE
jgi:hypothetical protein